MANKNIKMYMGQDIAKLNAEFYGSENIIEQFSSYQFRRNEKYLFKKYFRHGSSVLDLACGAGRTTLRLFEMGYKVKGIDLSDVLINTAVRRFPQIPFEIGSFSDIKEKDESYDNVLISFNGLDYAYPELEREEALGECVRVLKGGGYLILSSHNIKAFHGSPFYWKRHKLLLLKNILNAFYSKKYIYDFSASGWTFYSSPEYVINQVEVHGFELEEMLGFRTFFSKRQNKYLSPWIDYVFRKLV
jgi:ubiquinone/menaquinone biosynthesis C-methylase UbiE